MSCTYHLLDTLYHKLISWVVTLYTVHSHPHHGINLQDNMKWDTQVAHLTTVAIRVLGLIKRNLSHCSVQLQASAYAHQTPFRVCYTRLGPSTRLGPRHHKALFGTWNGSKDMLQGSWNTTLVNLKEQLLNWPRHDSFAKQKKCIKINLIVLNSQLHRYTVSKDH